MEGSVWNWSGEVADRQIVDLRSHHGTGTCGARYCNSAPAWESIRKSILSLVVPLFGGKDLRLQECLVRSLFLH